MCYKAAALYQSMQKLIDRSHDNKTAVDDYSVFSIVKERNLLACEMVDCLNETFGWNLLLTVPCLFLSIINSTFYILGENDNEQKFMAVDMLCCFVSIAHLIVLCSAADYISGQVRE